MVKLKVGNVETIEPMKNLNTTVNDPEISDEFLKIDMDINGRVLKMELSKAFTLQYLPEGTFSDADLDKQLERLSSWRAVILTASEELNLIKRNIQLEFDLWLAHASEETKIKVIDERLELKDKKGIPASWLGQITQKEVLDYILSRIPYGSEYQSFQSKINKIDHDESILRGLEKSLEQRSRDLGKIADGRRKQYRDTI
jgi:hypothetical protein